MKFLHLQYIYRCKCLFYQFGYFEIAWPSLNILVKSMLVYHLGHVHYVDLWSDMWTIWQQVSGNQQLYCILQRRAYSMF